MNERLPSCAWCKVKPHERHRYASDTNKDGICPCCGSYNDIGQKTITINSLRDIYDGAIGLMQHLTDHFRHALDYCGISVDDLGLDDNELSFCFYTSEIVRELFLSKGSSSGGTSAENMKRILGIREHDEIFTVFGPERED